MATYHDEGVVLRTIRLGETDRIVTFATPEHGKVRAVAKGIRKTKSRLSGRLEPLTHVNMMCWRGRELDVVSQVEVVEHFKAIRGDLERLHVAMTMLEVVDQVALERHAMKAMFQMLVGALRTLEDRLSPALLGSFLWKLLVLEGVGPSLDQCVGCGSDSELVAFDPGEGGFLCRTCRRGQSVGTETVILIRQVLSGGLRAALDQPPSRATAESERLAMLAAEYHLDRRLRSAHRGAEISTVAWQGWSTTIGLDAVPADQVPDAEAAPSAGLTPGVGPVPAAGGGSPPLAS